MRKLPVRLRVLLPAVENAISANAYRPGDVLGTRKGLTVEVGNTDAEGRLILCDALALADEDKPDLLIDMATLTGAARVALGPGATCAVQQLMMPWRRAGDIAAACRSDPLWRMPLWSGYEDELSSKIADLNNVSASPFSGAIFGALFLQRLRHARRACGCTSISMRGTAKSDRVVRSAGNPRQSARSTLSQAALSR